MNKFWNPILFGFFVSIGYPNNSLAATQAVAIAVHTPIVFPA
jgi:hypothetical protein